MGTAEHAVGTAVETQIQVEQAHKRVGRQNTFVTLLALLTLMALVLAMRKPRQAIVRVAGNAMEPVAAQLQTRRAQAGCRALPGDGPRRADGV